MVTPLSKDRIWNYLSEIPDPEIPAINIIELGVVRDVKIDKEQVEVIITPTYSGCPAMKMIEDDIYSHLKTNNIEDVKVTTILSPAWTTDWITDEAKEKLNKYGIAPPNKEIACPQCTSQNVECVSQFGSTPCKAQYRCKDCKEPFDYFKCH